MKPTLHRFAPLSAIVLTATLSLLVPQHGLASTSHDHSGHEGKAEEHAASPLNTAAQHDLKPIKRAGHAPASTSSVNEEVMEIAKKAVAEKHDRDEHETSDEHDDHAEDEASAVHQPKVTSEPAPGSHSEPVHQKAPASTTESHAEAATEHAPEHASVPAAASAHDSAPAVSADQSLRWLTNGNIRYVKRRFRADGKTQSDRDRLVKGQHPHAIILSCADSRVAPEIVFDQALGEVFTIRVAGEALDSSVIASIEYAVEHLGAKLLVVMGHTQCGAVDTALKVKEGDSAGSEALDKLLADIRPRLRTLSTEKPSPNLEVESTVNADGVARDLVKRSEIIRQKVDSGDLLIKPALYRIDSGKVTFY